MRIIVLFYHIDIDMRFLLLRLLLTIHQEYIDNFHISLFYFLYDRLNLHISYIHNRLSGVHYTYDFGDRLIQLKTTGKATQEYEYDASGTIIGIKDGVGNRITYELDLWGRIIEVQKGYGPSSFLSNLPALSYLCFCITFPSGFHIFMILS